MELERVRKELERRRFKINDELSEEVDEDYYFETYEKGNNLVEIGFSSYDVREVFISVPGYDFRTDDNDRVGINLRKRKNDKDYYLDEESFRYCLDLQENPKKHMIQFCKFYSEFLEWTGKELNPVLDHLEIRENENLYTSDEDYFQLLLCIAYEGEHEYLYININPLTFKVIIKFGIIGGRREEDFSYLYGEPSDIIYTAIEDLRNEIREGENYEFDL